MSETEKTSFFRSLRFQYGLGLLTFLAAAGYFLWAEHHAHILSFGSGFLILGLCLGMHFFMHGGHGGHSGGPDNDTDRTNGDTQ